MKRLALVLIGILCAGTLFAQAQLTQNIQGTVTDRSSGAPLPYVTIILLTSPTKGTTTNDEGEFMLKDVAVGRHDLQASFVGYEPIVIKEIMVTSS